MFSAATKTGSQPSQAANYIEDVFSTYLYTGNGTFSGETNAIINGIDLATKGGMVWIKDRTTAGTDNCVSDTVRGGTSKMLRTNSTAAATGAGSNLSFQSNGFTCLTSGTNTNYTGENYASWTFRKQPKFFDVVTFTATGSSQAISHSLGSTPGMIFFKRTDGASNWLVWNRTYPAQYYQTLNTTAASADLGAVWCVPTSTNVTVDVVFGAGQTWVAYLFAHDAGGFGTSGTDNVISCGSFTTGSSYTQVNVNLGYEPQFLMVKNATGTGNWFIADVMRGMPGGNDFTEQALYPNLSSAESGATVGSPNATGFSFNYGALNTTYIYMAIRRPMKVPTDATTVFKPVARTGNGSTSSMTGIGFAPDTLLCSSRLGYWEAAFYDRLRGFGQTLYTPLTNAEVADSTSVTAMGNTSIDFGAYGSVNASGQTYINYNFSRRPGFFDEVCYTGTGSATTQTHNLGVAPQLIIVKKRNASGTNWCVYSQATGNTQYLYLNTNDAVATFNLWNNTDPTSTVFSLSGSGTQVNGSGATYVAYLFATCPGVSKVGSYTGNGGTQAISCGFTGGARFVLIKRTDSTGDWYVYDTARGMTTLVDPYLLLNSTAAESATLGSVTSTAGGFTVNASILAAINTSGASYIFLAIA